MRYYALAAVLLLFTACKKETPAPLPARTVHPTFQKSGLSGFGPVRLFTRTGEVTNSALVAAYAEEFENYFYGPGSSFTDAYLMRFARVTADSMLNVSAAPVFELTRVPSGAYDRYKSRHYEIINDTNDLVLHLSTYKHFERVTTPGGYTYYDLESPSYVLRQVADTLFFPIARFITISRESNAFSFSAGKFNNVVDPAGAAKLGPKDTLVVQQFNLLMQKTPQ